MTESGSDEEYEEHAIFVGCTCNHEPDEHGWGECVVVTDGIACPCEGGGEE